MKDALWIRQMKKDDGILISKASTAIGWHKPESLYERYYREQMEGKRIALVAFVSDEFAGYGNVIWGSDYPPFREKQIPEISDLNVLPQFRRRGIASAIMDRAEALIFERSEIAGIGVGLYDGYGPAQRMYALRGYVPDGLGITCNDHQRVHGGDVVKADDDLVLWFMKRRGPQ